MTAAARHHHASRGFPGAYHQAVHQASQIVTVVAHGSIGSNLLLAVAVGALIFLVRPIARLLKRG